MLKGTIMFRWKIIAIIGLTAAPLSLAQSDAPRDPALEAQKSLRVTETRTQTRASSGEAGTPLVAPTGPYLQVEDPAAAIPADPRDPNFAKRHFEAVRIY